MYTFDPAVFRILTNSVSLVSLKVDQKRTKSGPKSVEISSKDFTGLKIIMPCMLDF